MDKATHKFIVENQEKTHAPHTQYLFMCLTLCASVYISLSIDVNNCENFWIS